MATVKRGYFVIARDLDVADAGIDAPDQRSDGRLDQAGFLGRPSGWSRCPLAGRGVGRLAFPVNQMRLPQ